MSEYTPDGWVILEQTQKDGNKEYFVFGSWSGSYLYGDSWRANSGIKSVEKDEKECIFHGYSGSIYRCSIHSEGRISAYNEGILQNLANVSNAEVITYDQFIKGFKNDNTSTD